MPLRSLSGVLGFYLVVLLLIIAADIRIVYGARVSWKDYNVGQKGTERFTTPEEIQRQYRVIPAKDQRYPGCGGFPVCRIKDKIFIDDGPVNNLIIGAPRSGKGESFVFPMIDLYSRAENTPSLVVIDPKLELYAASYQTLKSRGFVPLLLNTIDPAHSMGYNPLTPIAQAYQAGDYDYAQIQLRPGLRLVEGSQSERDGDFWLDNSANATAAMILAWWISVWKMTGFSMRHGYRNPTGGGSRSSFHHQRGQNFHVLLRQDLYGACRRRGGFGYFLCGAPGG